MAVPLRQVGAWMSEENLSGGQAEEARHVDPGERFRAIYRAHLADVTAYALRRTSSSEDAADVVAEVFLVAWRRLADVPSGDEARLWLYGVARRVLSNSRRGDLRRAHLSSRLASELSLLEALPALQPYRPPEGFAEVFASLSEADKEVLGLAVWEELDAASIGSVLGCSANAARIRAHRARKRLEKELRHRGIVKDGPSSGHRPDVPATPRRTDG